MADISNEELKSRIEEILKNAELANTSTKKVIKKLEADLNVDLSDRRKLIDQLVMDYVDSLDSDEEDEDVDVKKEEESEEEEPAPKKRKSEQKKKPESKSKKEKKAGGKPKGASKGNGYTRACKLSPALSELLGEESMPRHEVVKRIWGIIKEKNLYDPNNKRFVVCDKSLYKVIGTQRFRAFGMMKYLKTHFLD